MKKFFTLFLAVLTYTAIFSQQTYTWSGSSGGSWTTGANWTPNRTVTANNDIMVFNSGGSIIVVDVPTQTIGKLQVSGNTSITLRPQTTGNRTLTISTAATDALTVASGSTLIITGRDAGTDRTLTLTTANTAGLQANISGTVEIGLDNNQTAATGTFTKGGANATINFNSGSTYVHGLNSGNIPVSTWATTSTCNITGTTGTVPTGLGQSFGNFTWNATGQTGNLTLNGALTTVTGNFKVSSTNGQELRLTGNTSLTMTVGGDFTIENSSDLVITNGDNAAITINIAGSYYQNSGNFNFFTGTGGTNTLNATFNVNVTGNFNVSGTGAIDLCGGTSDVNGRNTKLNIGGNLSHTGTGVIQTSTTDTDISDATITFNKAGTQTCSVVPANIDWVNFTVASGSTLQLGSNISLTSSGTPVWGGKFTVNTGGTLDAGTYQILSDVTGGQNNSFTLSSGSTLKTANVNGVQNGTSGTVSTELSSTSLSTSADYKFTGTGPQVTTGMPATINSIEINNGSGVTLSAATTANSATTPLILTNGILKGATLTISSNYTGAGGGGSAASHVSVAMAKTGSTAYEFPIGNGTVYRPVSVSSLSGSATMTAQYFQANPRTTFGATLGSGVNHIGVCEYWTLDDGPVTITGIVGLNFGSSCNGNEYVNDPSTLLVAHWTGTQWASQGNDGTATMTSVKASVASTFSPFTIGSSSINNPLPVKIGSINAYERLNGVQIDWTAYTESNMDKYIVERSADGVHFTALGNVAALNNGNETQYGFFDPSPYAGLNFYRLHILDKRGVSSYSNIVRIDLRNGNADITMYPNPVQTGGYISYNSPSLAKGIITARIFSAAGQQLYMKQYNHVGGAVNQTIALPAGMKAGFYTLQLDNNGTKVAAKTFIVQ